MSEWWTYRPRSFLLFAPETYWRLFELHNLHWWPLPLLAPVAGTAAALWLASRLVRGPQAGHALRAALLLMAALWAFVALAFLQQRYAPINPAAPALAAAFGVQAAGLLLLAALPGLQAAAPGPRRRAAALLVAWALLGHPLLAWALGRPWAQAEVVALAPDPTVLATLGLLCTLHHDNSRGRWLLRALWVVPLAWWALSLLTLWTLGSAQAAILAALLPAVYLLAHRLRRGPGARRTA
jgi:hypothetical protein